MCDVAVERDAQLQSGAEPEQTSAAGSQPRGGLTLAATPAADSPLLSAGKKTINMTFMTGRRESYTANNCYVVVKC